MRVIHFLKFDMKKKSQIGKMVLSGVYLFKVLSGKYKIGIIPEILFT